MSPHADKLGRGSAGYPQRLAPLADAPEALHAQGRWVERELSVAIVGSRAASREGVERARELAAELGRRGAQIVSGGALGIDAAAHEGALAAGAHTAAVLACGLDNPYPERNRGLFADIEAAGGALLSPYGPGRPPRRYHFVRRNRVMAGMADAVVLVDCGPGSGAMHTAEAARAYGRTVAAAPGSAGCEALIAQGAAVVEEAGDVISAIEGAPRRPVAELPSEGSPGSEVLAALTEREPRDEDRIAELTGLSVRTVTRALAELELSGLAVLCPGRAYLRSFAAGAAESGRDHLAS